MDYQNPLETSTSPVRRYHTYRLESLIVPRNLASRACARFLPARRSADHSGHRDGLLRRGRHVRLAPINAPGQGQVESYIIEWNTTGSNAVFQFVRDVGPNPADHHRPRFERALHLHRRSGQQIRQHRSPSSPARVRLRPSPHLYKTALDLDRPTRSFPRHRRAPASLREPCRYLQIPPAASPVAVHSPRRLLQK